MSNSTHFCLPGKLLLVIGLFLIGMGYSEVLYAQEKSLIQASFSKDGAQPINIDLLIGQSRIIEVDEEFDSVVTSIPNIIMVELPGTRRLLVVNGRGVGQVNLVVLKERKAPGEKQQSLIFNIFVQKNLNMIDSKIKILYPKENIELSQVNDSIVLSGSVTNPQIAKDVVDILTKGGIKEVVNLLKSPAPIVQQVELQVRIAEVNKAIARQVGAAYGIMNRNSPIYLNPGGVAPGGGTVTGGYANGQTSTSRTGGGAVTSALSLTSSLSGLATNIFLGRPDLTSAFINALQTRNAIRTLAEPNIITESGKIGKFHSGGRVPIPIITSGSNGQSGFSVQYENYGVKLEFKPIILDENHIQIELTSEVSSLDPDITNGINSGGIIIKGIRTNSASTSLELADGQSFAIAGLLDNSENVNYSEIPLLSNIPILGNLFKSKSFSRKETELMFLCTVKLREPMNPDQIPRLPGAPPTNLPAQPTSNKSNDSSGAAFAPLPELTPDKALDNLSLPSASLLEGSSGHDVPRKKSEALKPTPKSDN